MINQQKANWKKLNWVKGLDRIYLIVWALIALKVVAEFFDDKHFGIVNAFLAAVVIPLVVRQLVIWVAKGFQK